MTTLTHHFWKGDLRNRKTQVDYEFIFNQVSYLKVLFHEVEISKVNYGILIFLQFIP